MDMILYVTKETADAIKIKDIINYPGSPNIITWAFRSRVLSLAEEEAMPQKGRLRA